VIQGELELEERYAGENEATSGYSRAIMAAASRSRST
jgi:hypothetical protein